MKRLTECGRVLATKSIKSLRFYLQSVMCRNVHEKKLWALHLPWVRDIGLKKRYERKLETAYRHEILRWSQTSTVVVSWVPDYFSRKAALFLRFCFFHLLFTFLSLLCQFKKFNPNFFCSIALFKAGSNLLINIWVIC